MKSLFGTIFFVLQAFFALFVLLSLAAPYVPPLKLSFVAFFGLGFPILGLLLVFMWVYYLLRISWKGILIYSLLIVLSLPQWCKLVQFNWSSQEVAPPSKELKVLSYNVRLLGYYEAKKNKQQIRRNIIRYIHSGDFDVVCLQEFYKNYLGDFNTLDTLRSLGYTYFHEYYSAETRGQQFGLVTLSKYPIKKAENISFGAGEHNAACKVSVEKNGKRINVYNFHIGSIRFQKDDYKIFDDQPAEFLPKKEGRRLLKRLYDAFKRRNTQVNTLARMVAKDKNPKIIMGDLNDSPNSYAYQQLSQGNEDAFISKGFGISNTYNGKIPSYRIDYIWYQNLQCLSYQKQEVGYSDHFPINAKFTWD